MDSRAESNRKQGNLIRLGTVAELDLQAARCRVRSGGILSDFVPWLVPRAGDTVEWSAPTVGEQVLLLCPQGDTVGALVLRGVYSDQVRPPESAAERHLVKFVDGAVIQYDHVAHALTAQLPPGATAAITADGGVTINGPLTVNGDTEVNGNTQINGDTGITGTATADVDMVGAGISLKDHVHLGVTAGSSTSGKPQ